MPIINGGTSVPELPPPLPPEPAPDQPTAPEQWPWPLNLLQNFLTNAFAWIGDRVNYVINDLGGDITTFFHNLDDNLTNLGDWLKSQIDTGIKEAQTHTSNVVGDFQTQMVENIKGTQDTITEAITATQGGLDAAISGTQQLLDDGIKGVQDEVNLQVGTVQKTLEEAVDPDRGVVPTLIREVPEAIVTFVNVTVGPVLKGLNDLLEEI